MPSIYIEFILWFIAIIMTIVWNIQNRGRIRQQPEWLFVIVIIYLILAMLMFRLFHVIW